MNVNMQTLVGNDHFANDLYYLVLVACKICNSNTHIGQITCDISCKWQGILDERKSQQNTPSSFD